MKKAKRIKKDLKKVLTVMWWRDIIVEHHRDGHGGHDGGEEAREVQRTLKIKQY